jgi:hypothetical protein
LTIEERLARLDVTVGGRSRSGTRAVQGEDSGCNGQQRDEADGDD